MARALCHAYYTAGTVGVKVTDEAVLHQEVPYPWPCLRNSEGRVVAYLMESSF